jgi:hypothetical protein
MVLEVLNIRNTGPVDGGPNARGPPRAPGHLLEEGSTTALIALQARIYPIEPVMVM